jgi:enamine deaminase RidA (YjgF/YER057c/UK114 family)
VRVPDAPLVWTGQVFATESGGAREPELALQALDAALGKAGSDLSHVVRLNAYVADERARHDAEAAFAKQFTAAAPALTVVQTPLEQSGASVAWEAVALSTDNTATVKVSESGIAVMPAGAKIFISGQAERGADLASAVKLTMAGLHRSLAHLGLKKSDVVQVKAFMKPFSEHATARREMAASFDGAAAPPTVLMEWVSDLFVEIELVVSARTLPPPAEKITHAWLPWLTKSPRFCNVTQVAAGTPLIFIGAVAGDDASDPRTQMKTIFERLGSTLFEAGSSYRHLAKATYYLGHADARNLLGDIREVYYDPTRPPAASALNMNGLGYPGRAAMIDMIAVPVK